MDGQTRAEDLKDGETISLFVYRQLINQHYTTPLHSTVHWGLNLPAKTSRVSGTSASLALKKRLGLQPRAVWLVRYYQQGHHTTELYSTGDTLVASVYVDHSGFYINWAIRVYPVNHSTLSYNYNIQAMRLWVWWFAYSLKKTYRTIQTFRTGTMIQKQRHVVWWRH